jgi:hypothetical protein
VQHELPPGTRVLIAFPLGQHQLALLHEVDGSLTLWLDGCLRKRRGGGGGSAYLWTNVELPFEDHHLVEVRRSSGDAPIIDVSVNGVSLHRLEASAAALPESASGPVHR